MRAYIEALTEHQAIRRVTRHHIVWHLAPPLRFVELVIRIGLGLLTAVCGLRDDGRKPQAAVVYRGTPPRSGALTTPECLSIFALGWHSKRASASLARLQE